MQGHVYQMVSSNYGNQPHLYVVVLEFTGNKDCIVVPAFSADGFMVNQIIQARLDQGARLDEIVVTVDNSSCIQFSGHHTGKIAHWLVSDADRLLISDVQGAKFIGTMDSAALGAIAAGLLNFAPNVTRFSPNVVKKLRKLINI